MRFLAVLTMVPLFASCATIVGDKDQVVSINSSPDGATVLVKDEAGDAVFKGVTPASVTLKKGDGYFDGQDYTIEFSKAGYENQVVSLETSLSGWYLFGNLVFGGLIGWFIVDPLTGAMWSLDDTVQVVLHDTQP